MADQKMSPEEVSESIREAMVKEEFALPLYISHIKEAFFWSGLSKGVRDEIVEGLKILERETEGHVKLLKEVEKIYLNSVK